MSDDLPGQPASFARSASPPRPHARSPLLTPTILSPTDADGQSVTLTVRVTPEQRRELEMTLHTGLATGCYPWETLSDLLRQVIPAGLHVLTTTQRDDDRTQQAYHQALTHAEDTQALIRQIRRLHQTIADTTAELLSMGQDQAAVTFLHHQAEAVLDMPVSPPRDWLLETLARDYEAFLVSAQHPASLSGSSLGQWRARIRRRVHRRGHKISKIRG